MINTGIFQLSNIIHHPYQSVQCVCVCVCVCVCARIFCITLEPLSTLCVSFFLFSHVHFLLLITFSISMYIMCVILCLFSALSRRAGALQISIIIIIIIMVMTVVSSYRLRLGSVSPCRHKARVPSQHKAENFVLMKNVRQITSSMNMVVLPVRQLHTLLRRNWSSFRFDKRS